jgi:uncharacterized membrane protein YobD (UPF0266 family)
MKFPFPPPHYQISSSTIYAISFFPSKKDRVEPGGESVRTAKVSNKSPLDAVVSVRVILLAFSSDYSKCCFSSTHLYICILYIIRLYIYIIRVENHWVSVNYHWSLWLLSG